MDKNMYKDLRKAAFAVGLGFTIGRYVGRILNSVVDGAGRALVSTWASHGDEFSQKVCDNCNIEYNKKVPDDEPKMKIGF